MISQEKYKDKAIELNGPDFDWLHSPVDARALYACNCGRPHGKWALFNGAINDSEALADLKRSHASAMAARRQRQEEEDRMRKEASDSRVAKEYAQNMLDWGKSVHTQMENIQRFMEVRCVIYILVYSFECQCSHFLIVCNNFVNCRVLLSTLVCQPQQFHLPCLHHLSLQYIMLYQLQIPLRTM
jgi:hypothetical protein